MSDKPLCAHCGMTPHPGCNGLGKVYVDDTTLQDCRNMRIVSLRKYLGDEIHRVPYVKSPLLKLGGVGEPKILEDRTKDNLVLNCDSWAAMLPHLKWTLSFKGLGFVVRIVTDLRLKNVFVGNEGYKSRSLYERDDRVTFNSLDDLVGETVDLAIIKLGYLGYKNRAAAGCLKEALLLRKNCRKPTWLVIDRKRPWEHSREEEIEEYIGKEFERITLTTDAEIVAQVVRDPDPDEEDDASTDEETKEIEDRLIENEGPPDEAPDYETEDEGSAEDRTLSDVDSIARMADAQKKPKYNKWGRR